MVRSLVGKIKAFRWINSFRLRSIYIASPLWDCGGGRQAGGRGCGGRSNFATTGGRNVRTTFANFTASQSRLPPIGVSGGRGGGMAPFLQQTPAHNAAPIYSIILKIYANWKLCFSCWGWAYIKNVSGTMEAGKSSGRIWSNKCKSVHFGRVRCVHKGNAQKPVA